jgi:hypothetical protein
VFGIEAANTTAQPGMARNEIEQRILYHAKLKTSGFDPLATLRLSTPGGRSLAGRSRCSTCSSRRGRAVAAQRGACRSGRREPTRPDRTRASSISQARDADRERRTRTPRMGIADLIARITTTTTAGCCVRRFSSSMRLAWVPSSGECARAKCRGDQRARTPGQRRS